MNRRLGAAGAALVVAGGLAAVAGGADGAPVAVALAAGVGATLAALAVGFGVGDAQEDAGGGKQPDPTVGERLVGEEVDAALAALSGLAGRALADAPERERVREAVAVAAVGELVRAGATPEAARDRLARGTWTDDPRAAAFLGGPRPPLAVRAADRLAAEPACVRRAQAAVRAVEGIGEGGAAAAAAGVSAGDGPGEGRPPAGGERSGAAPGEGRRR